MEYFILLDNISMNFGAIWICLLFTPPLSSSPVSCRAPRLIALPIYLLSFFSKCQQWTIPQVTFMQRRLYYLTIKYL